MPWSETSPMDERFQFVADVRRAHESMTALCDRYGISRKTGYKWCTRYAVEGPAGLLEHSRRPHSSPAATSDAVITALLALRARHPRWGGKKLVAVLARRAPALPPLAPSTAAALLQRHGCITRPRRQRALGHPGRPNTSMLAPNDTWTADFKGQFKTGDGRYCYPLTVVDGASRFLLACRALTSVRTVEARPVFERLFRIYGLPERLRSDNGVPFATTALARLSPLSVWWIRLGIRPELIEPGHPEQNGRHERMHKTLKAESTRPPAATLAAQQRVFDAFRAEFNEERPHEALDQCTPASCYVTSPRRYMSRLTPLEYPAHCEVRRVSLNGGIRWHEHWVNVSHVLGGEYISFEEIDDALWQVSFGPVALGRFHEALLRIEDQHGDLARTRRRTAPYL
jgi:putative transposase